VLCVGLFADGSYGDGLNGVAGGVGGLFYGFGAKQLVAQMIGIAVCITWNVVAAGTVFWVIGKVLGTNRVPAAVEIAGLDVPEMGVPGYPEFIKVVAPEEVPEHEVKAAETMFARSATPASV